MTVDTQTLPIGYKQTEIGVIPADWDIEPIKTFATIKTGSKNTQDRIADGLYPFFVRSQKVERINSFSFDGEAVLTAGDGVGTGKVFHYINGKFDIHQRVYKISDFSKRVDGYFFFLYFSNNFFNRIMQMTAKSSVDSVRMEMIADMQVPIPSKPEQSAIAAVLSDADALIEKLETLLEKKKNIKQGTMQELLTGKRRLPGFSGEWETMRLEDVVEINMGQSPSSVSYNTVEQGIPLIQGNADIKDRKSIGRVWTTQPTKTCRAGDLIMTVRAPVGLIGMASFDSCLGRGVCSFKIKNIEKNFLFHSLIFYEDAWKILEQGSTFTAANSNQIKVFKITIPATKQEQVAIASTLSEIDTEIENLQSQLSKYQNLKQGMMQALLTGKIRLI